MTILDELVDDMQTILDYLTVLITVKTPDELLEALERAKNKEALADAALECAEEEPRECEARCEAAERATDRAQKALDEAMKGGTP
jgi:hypothetical protein